jgi:hypothetical protein|tara:strand:+ start:298 stop:465 length:168 start_codon:yes stop_codon:yes gene_type:complete
MINSKEKNVFNLFEDIMASDLDEYQIKQLAMLLIANTLNEKAAKDTAEAIVERNS